VKDENNLLTLQAEYKDKDWVLLIEVDGEYKIAYETDTAKEMIAKIENGIKERR